MTPPVAPRVMIACALALTGCAVRPAPPPPSASPSTAPSTRLSTAQADADDGDSPDTAPSQIPKEADLHQRGRGDRRTFPALLAHRPIYVLLGPEVPNVKFQVSTKVPLLFPGGPETPDPVFSNVYFGYTQMSLWDVKRPGSATIDTTFEPELFFATQTPPVDFPGFRASGIGVRVGVQHESNGRSGDASRNANYFYLQPTLYFGDRKGLHGEVAAKGRVFFSTLQGNPDLEDYYGHVEVYGALRFGDDLHVTAMGRLADDPSRGAFQIDITYPLQKLRLDAFGHLQFFNGYTESLLDYKEHHQAVRLGVSFVR